MMFWSDLTSLEIHILQCVEFCHHNVDVVRTNAMAQGRDALALVRSCDGMELTARHLTFFRVEKRCNHIDTAWIATHDDLVGKLFWTKMQMKHTSISIDD